MKLDDALAEISAHIEPGRAESSAVYHKQTRKVLGVSNPSINTLAQGWRQTLTLDARVQLADDLWQTNIFEARITAAKLLTQARIQPDQNVWHLIVSWVPDFDSWAIADHACTAGQKRITADPSRIAQVETWTQSEHMWTRRAALVIMLPWTKSRYPKDQEIDAREQVLRWSSGYVDDHDWFIQKAVAWWLRDLSKRDPDRVQTFLETHGDRMKPFARREAAKYLPPKNL